MEGLKIKPRYSFIGYRDIGEQLDQVPFGEGDVDNISRILAAVSIPYARKLKYTLTILLVQSGQEPGGGADLAEDILGSEDRA